MRRPWPARRYKAGALGFRTAQEGHGAGRAPGPSLALEELAVQTQATGECALPGPGAHEVGGQGCGSGPVLRAEGPDPSGPVQNRAHGILSEQV